jgi:hypothetical protein
MKKPKILEGLPWPKIPPERQFKCKVETIKVGDGVETMRIMPYSLRNKMEFISGVKNLQYFSFYGQENI